MNPTTSPLTDALRVNCQEIYRSADINLAINKLDICLNSHAELESLARQLQEALEEQQKYADITCEDIRGLPWGWAWKKLKASKRKCDHLRNTALERAKAMLGKAGEA